MKIKNCQFQLNAMVLAGILVCLSIPPVFGSLSIPKAIENLICTKSGEVLSLEQVKKIPASELKIEKKNKKAFLKSYKVYLSNYNKTLSDYRQFVDVAIFTAIRHGDVVHPGKPGLASKALNDPDNSLYVAFALLTGAGIDYERIGSREHLQTLANSYGISVVQIENGIWETLTRDWQQILDLVVLMIGTHLQLTGDGLWYR